MPGQFIGYSYVAVHEIQNFLIEIDCERGGNEFCCISTLSVDIPNLLRR